MHSFSSRLGLMLLTLCWCCSCTSQPAQSPQPAVIDSVETCSTVQTDTLPTLTLLFAGDMMQHVQQLKAARVGSDYDYTGVFDAVRDEISRADVAIANLETTLGSKTYAGYPCFSSPNSWAKALQDAGFDILQTANNHCVDRKAKGLRGTIEVLDSLCIPHLGTYLDEEARRQQTPLVIEVKGFRVALLCYTYGTNGIVAPEPFVVNTLDTVRMAEDLSLAQSMDVDAIIVMPHWGIEHKMLPSVRQKKLAAWLLKHGATHVVGGHPHVCQPVELQEDTLTGQRHLVAYSLGNYVSHMIKINSTGGMMLRLTLTRDEAGRCVLQDADYSLVWVSRPEISGQRVHRVLPALYPDSLLTPADRAQRDTFMRNARAILNEHNKGVSEYFF